MKEIIDLNDFSELKKLSPTNKIAALKMVWDLVANGAEIKNATIVGLAEKIKELKTLDKRFKNAKIFLANPETAPVAEFSNVVVRLPFRPKTEEAKIILQYSSNMEEIEIIGIPEYFHFCPVSRRLDNGHLAPAVVINFFNAPEDKRGKTIAAKIVIGLKKNPNTQITELIIDAYYEPTNKRPTRKLVTGCDKIFKSRGDEYQIPIPEMPNKCVEIGHI